MTLLQPLTEPGMKEKVREILTFVEGHIDALTPLYFTDADRETLRDNIAMWRWYLSHGYFKKPDQKLQKPPISWLYNIMVSHRAVTDLVSRLAAPAAKPTLPLQGDSEILMIKLSRIRSYVKEEPVPKTFYLAPDHPDKTDQMGIPFSVSSSRAAIKWRKRKDKARKAKESLVPKPKPELSEEERDKIAKKYLKEKNKQRADERKRRADAKKEAARRHEAAEREREKARRDRYGR